MLVIPADANLNYQPHAGNNNNFLFLQDIK